MSNWKSLACIGFPQYEVSEVGQVRHHLNPLPIVQHHNIKGYLRVNVWIVGKGVKHLLVHRLVAIVWVPNPLVKPIVNHINENILENERWNLDWLTNKENVQYSIDRRRKELKENSPF